MTRADQYAGYVNTTTCSMTSAIAEYPIMIKDQTITFPDPPSYPKIIALANNTAMTNETMSQPGNYIPDYPELKYSTLGGIAIAANFQ